MFARKTFTQIEPIHQQKGTIMLKKILVGVAVTLGLAVVGAFIADRAGLLD